MKKFKHYFLTLFLITTLMGCDEGAALNSEVVENSEILNEKKDIEENSKESLKEGTQVLQLDSGGAFFVKEWSLYDTISDSGISMEELSPGRLDSETPVNILLVTIEMSNTADYYGNVNKSKNVNDFFPVTPNDIDASYLPDPEPDVENQLWIEHGREAIYLDKGNFGASNYFELSFSEEGECITYVLGYSLSEEEYRVAKEGKLCLVNLLDNVQRKEELKLLRLTLDSFVKG